MAGGVSNADIMNAIIKVSTDLSEVRAIAIATQKQATKTNGRVNTIEEWKTGLQAVAAYQKDHPAGQNISAPNATTVVVQPQKWFQNDKLVVAVVILLGAAASAISFFVGGGAGVSQ